MCEKSSSSRNSRAHSRAQRHPRDIQFENWSIILTSVSTCLLNNRMLSNNKGVILVHTQGTRCRARWAVFVPKDTILSQHDVLTVVFWIKDGGRTRSCFASDSSCWNGVKSVNTAATEDRSLWGTHFSKTFHIENE